MNALIDAGKERMTETTIKRNGNWWLAIMGLFLIAAGLFFAWRMWLSYEMTAISRTWTAVPCRIESSRILSERATTNSALTHRVEIRYSYDFAGDHFQSTRIQHVNAAPTAHLDKVEALQQSYPPGAERTCYVNPQAPMEAVLKQGSRGALFSIWFPLLFAIGGSGMLIGVIRARRNNSSK